MDTLVSITVVTPSGAVETAEIDARIEHAFGWFEQIEACCSRFDPESEVMRLLERVGEPVAVSPMLYGMVRFALAVARQSRGAFDPTVGFLLERRGFNRDYRSGRRIISPLAPDSYCSYRDVELDPMRRTITLRRPLILDLGAVAKGLAIDLAARELDCFDSFAINAGGDLFVRGGNADGVPWRIGIRHPRQTEHLIATLQLHDQAVCTSGDYERRTAENQDHHILDPRTGAPASGVISVTVIAPSAMVADALGTAAFVLGPARGIPWLERQGVEGLMILPTLDCVATRGFLRYLT
ncbi:MAG: FAD:protein FMN transferase [Chloroflexi bacterium]|nr:FAD:protein FMN transferase [Chloroflexota bacterium]